MGTCGCHRVYSVPPQSTITPTLSPAIKVLDIQEGNVGVVNLSCGCGQTWCGCAMILVNVMTCHTDLGQGIIKTYTIYMHDPHKATFCQTRSIHVHDTQRWQSFTEHGAGDPLPNTMHGTWCRLPQHRMYCITGTWKGLYTVFVSLENMHATFVGMADWLGNVLIARLGRNLTALHKKHAHTK